MGVDPETYYVSDHYSCFPWMSVRLAGADPDVLRDLLLEAWRRNAPRRLVASHPK